MKAIFCLMLLCSTAAAAFEVSESKFTVPDAAAICESNEVMFGGASFIYGDCSDGIESIVVSKIDSNRSFTELHQFIEQYQPDGSFTDYDITDALYDGTIVAITPFDDNMQVTSNGAALRFCLIDRTVYLVRHENNWTTVTILQE